jgi:NAD(P)-dependent dehydrogenase (short-subunit alcohol dehydrogenase family)
VVDGKPVAPKLTTLDVNLKGVFYCKQCPLPTTPCARWHSRSVDPTAVHLGMHYVMRNRTPSSWKAIVMIGSAGSYPHLACFYFVKNQTDPYTAASWVGLPSAPQYTASKHAVLGLMRSLDPVVAADNIRIAVIHPWFAGNASAPPRASPLMLGALIGVIFPKTRQSLGSP